METISAIITSYNYAKWLPDAVNSLLAQSCPLHEIIVVDDASTDDTMEVMGELMDLDNLIRETHKAQPERGLRFTRRVQDDPPVHLRYVRSTANQGLPTSRNLGISLSVGELILILDADDMVAPDFALDGLAFLRRNTDTSGVYFWQAHFGKPEVEGRIWKNPCWNFQSLLVGNMMNDNSLYRRRVWEDCRKANGHGYNPVMWGFCGWEFYINAAELGHKFQVIEKPYYLWRRGHQDLTTVGGRAWAKRDELFAQIRALHPKLYEEGKEYKIGW